MIVSYVKECRAFTEFASDERITANEVVLWHALFELFNRRAASSIWPDGFIPLPNGKVLALTTFGSGDSANETLRKARDNLKNRGLIDYIPGEKRKKAPMYRLHYFHALPIPQEETEGFTQNKFGKPLVKPPGKPLGKPLDIKEKDIDLNPDITHIYPLEEQHRARGLSAWRDDVMPRKGGYRREDGTMERCRFDAGWLHSQAARGAIAQRLMDAFPGEMDTTDLWGSLVALMADGLPPEVIDDALSDHDRASGLLARMRAVHTALGYAGEREQQETNSQWASNLAAAGGDPQLAGRLARLQGELGIHSPSSGLCSQEVCAWP